jgi:hypothetical protein
MKIKRLEFFAKKPAYPEVPFKVKQGIEPHDRDFLSFIYEHKPIFINGAKFTANHITARPAKKTVFSEILFFTVIMFCWLHFFGPKLPANILITKYIIGCVLSAMFGASIGLIRIEKQKSLADKFNKS